MRDQCEKILALNHHVCVSDDAINVFAKGLSQEDLRMPTWLDDPWMFEGHPEEVITWLVTYNAINFSYWPDPGEKRWWTTVNGEEVGKDDEALGVMAVIGESIRNGVPFHDWKWLSQLEEDELSAILAPAPKAGKIPLLRERLEALHDLAGARIKYGGPVSLFESCGRSVAKFVNSLVESCPKWKDVGQYAGIEVSFNKRAWLCGAMIHARLNHDHHRRFTDSQTIPVFADYRLPQVLRRVGVMTLSDDLSARIEQCQPVGAGSPEEVALRAAVVAACFRIQDALHKHGRETQLMNIDHMLWRDAVANDESNPPFHRTRTTAY